MHETMTPRERVRTVYAFRQPDRLPYGELTVNHPVASALLGREAWCGFGGYVRGKLHNTCLIEGRRDEFAERFTRDTLEVNRRLGFDLFPVQFLPERGSQHGISEVEPNVWRVTEDDGRWAVFRWDPQTDFYGEVASSFEVDPERELRLMIEDVRRAPVQRFADGELDFLRQARQELPERFLWGYVGFSFPYSVEGLMSLVELPALWREYNERLAEKHVTSIDAQIAEGVDAFWCGSDWAYKTGPMIAPATFRELFLEPYRRIVAHVHARGYRFIHHTDGNIELFEPMWFDEIGMDGYHALEPSAGVDILAVRRRWPRLLLHGNLDCGELLTNGTPAAIEAEVVRLIEGLAAHSGWVFSSSNSIHSAVPLENALAMIEAVRRHGAVAGRA